MVQHQVKLLQLQLTFHHNLTGGTPIKIRGINVPDYNISTKVSNVIDETQI